MKLPPLRLEDFPERWRRDPDIQILIESGELFEDDEGLRAQWYELMNPAFKDLEDLSDREQVVKRMVHWLIRIASGDDIPDSESSS